MALFQQTGIKRVYDGLVDIVNYNLSFKNKRE